MGRTVRAEADLRRFAAVINHPTLPPHPKLPNEILLAVLENVIPQEGLTLSCTGNEDTDVKTLAAIAKVNSFFLAEVERVIFSRPLHLVIDSDDLVRPCLALPRSLITTRARQSADRIGALPLGRWKTIVVHIDAKLQFYDGGAFDQPCWRNVGKGNASRKVPSWECNHLIEELAQRASMVGKFLLASRLLEKVLSGRVKVQLTFQESPELLTNIRPSLPCWSVERIRLVLRGWNWIGLTGVGTSNRRELKDHVTLPAVGFACWHDEYDNLADERGHLAASHQVRKELLRALRSVWCDIVSDECTQIVNIYHMWLHQSLEVGGTLLWSQAMAFRVCGKDLLHGDEKGWGVLVDMPRSHQSYQHWPAEKRV